MQHLRLLVILVAMVGCSDTAKDAGSTTPPTPNDDSGVNDDADADADADSDSDTDADADTDSDTDVTGETGYQGARPVRAADHGWRLVVPENDDDEETDAGDDAPNAVRGRTDVGDGFQPGARPGR